MTQINAILQGKLEDQEKETEQLRDKLSLRPLLYFSDLVEDDKQLHFWTGLPSKEAFFSEFRSVEQDLEKINLSTGTPKKKNQPAGVPLPQKFLWFLVRLRRGFPFLALAYLFAADAGQLCREIALISQIMAANTISQIRVLHGDELLARTPQYVQEANPQTEVHNTDATYFYIQKAQNMTLQRDTFSTHKGRNLLKSIAITTTDGCFEALSFPSLGSRSDPAVWRERGMDQFFDYYVEHPELRCHLNVDKGMGIVPPNSKVEIQENFYEGMEVEDEGESEEKGKGRGRGKENAKGKGKGKGKGKERKRKRKRKMESQWKEKMKKQWK